MVSVELDSGAKFCRGLLYGQNQGITLTDVYSQNSESACLKLWRAL